MWKNIVERCRTQMAIWRMRIACWIPKAKNTHSQYVILIISHNKNGCTTCLIVTFYVHCPSPRSFCSPGLCKLPDAVPFQTSYLQSTDVPPRDAVPIFSSLSICRHKSPQSLVCMFLFIHVIMRRVRVMYVYSKCWRIIFIGKTCQAAQWTRVSTRGIDEKNVGTLKRFVNFYCRCGKSFAILPPYYARTSCWTEDRVTLICRQNTPILSVGRS